MNEETNIRIKEHITPIMVIIMYIAFMWYCSELNSFFLDELE